MPSQCGLHADMPSHCDLDADMPSQCDLDADMPLQCDLDTDMPSHIKPMVFPNTSKINPIVAKGSQLKSQHWARQ